MDYTPPTSGTADVYRAGQLIAPAVRFELRVALSGGGHQELVGKIDHQLSNDLPVRELVTLRFDDGHEMDFFLEGTELRSAGRPRPVAGPNIG